MESWHFVSTSDRLLVGVTRKQTPVAFFASVLIHLMVLFAAVRWLDRPRPVPEMPPEAPSERMARVMLPPPDVWRPPAPPSAAPPTGPQIRGKAGTPARGEGPHEHRRSRGGAAEDPARAAPGRGPHAQRRPGTPRRSGHSGCTQGGAAAGAAPPATQVAGVEAAPEAGDPSTESAVGSGGCAPRATHPTRRPAPPAQRPLLDRRIPPPSRGTAARRGCPRDRLRNRPANGAAVLRPEGGGLHGLDQSLQERGLPELDRPALGPPRRPRPRGHRVPRRARWPPFRAPHRQDIGHRPPWIAPRSTPSSAAASCPCRTTSVPPRWRCRSRSSTTRRRARDTSRALARRPGPGGDDRGDDGAGGELPYRPPDGAHLSRRPARPGPGVDRRSRGDARHRAGRPGRDPDRRAAGVDLGRRRDPRARGRRPRAPGPARDLRLRLDQRRPQPVPRPDRERHRRIRGPRHRRSRAAGRGGADAALERGDAHAPIARRRPRRHAKRRRRWPRAWPRSAWREAGWSRKPWTPSPAGSACWSPATR